MVCKAMNVLGVERIMIIAAHPDDEVLGLGGTVKRLTHGGVEVVTVLTCRGRKSQEHATPIAAKKVGQLLGVKDVLLLNYPNLRLETFPVVDICKNLEELIIEFSPNMIFTHHYGDLNRDHQITYQAVLTAARPIGDTSVQFVVSFETVSSSEWVESTSAKMFKPNLFIDITDTYSDKIRALRFYDMEMRDYPHPRSYEGVELMARVRGMTVGVPYAEAFELIRGTLS